MMKRPDGSCARGVTNTQLIHEWAHALQAKGHHILDASRGRPSFPVDPDALHAMKQFFESITPTALIPYGTHPFGEYQHRHDMAQALAKLYNIPYTAEDIAFTPGGQFGISAAFYAIFKQQPRGVVLAPCPWYLNHHELAHMVQSLLGERDATDIFLPVLLLAEPNFRLTAHAIRKAIASSSEPIRAFLFCNPNNPLGIVTRKEEWKEIAALLHEYPDTPILLDEAFMEIIFDHDDHCSLLHAAPELASRTFLFRSGTKALGFPGERLAVMTIPKPYQDEMCYLQSRLIGNPSLSSQLGLTAAMATNPLSKYHRIASYYATHAHSLIETINELGIGLSKDFAPEGGFYTIIDLSRFLGTPIPDAAKAALDIAYDHCKTDTDIVFSLLFGVFQQPGYGLALIPASCFGIDGAKGYARLSFSIPDHEILLLKNTLTAMMKRHHSILTT